MTETVVFRNVYMCYVDNDPYKYPSIEVPTIVSGNNSEAELISTGWHIIPNFLWRHVCTPKQWFQLVTQFESYSVKGINGVIYNPIPITTNISLQRVSQFSAFNNCTYGMTYTDRHYETQFMEWNNIGNTSQLHLGQREGLIWYGAQTGTDGSHMSKRYQWPKYKWRRPNMRTPIHECWAQGKGDGNGVYDVAGAEIYHSHLRTPNGVFWDPFNCPDQIGELRAGKNSISFSWETAACDQGKFFNLDLIASYAEYTVDGPYMGQGRPWTLKMTTDMDPSEACTYGVAEVNDITQNPDGSGTFKYHDYTIPNYCNMPIVPTKWFWKEIQTSIIDWYGGGTENNDDIPMWKKANKYWSGTEWETYAYPPCQWFCKGIPLYDASNNPIKTTTQVSFSIEIHLECQKRRSAYFAPTFGPFSGDQLYYLSNKRNIFQPSCIRYRSAGRRRTWQNMQSKLKLGTNTTNTNIVNLETNPRQDNFYWAATTLTELQYNNRHGPTGIGDAASANRSIKPQLKMTINRETDETVIEMDEETQDEPEPAPRKTLSAANIKKLLSLN
ncbi:capsid protein 1 [Chaphamaparvovirus galliform5]|nr:capsid protein 1 [Chaphamaparvovirus galliform5]